MRSIYRERSGHPASWIRSLSTALASREDIDVIVLSHSRAVTKVEEVWNQGVRFVFIPKYEPSRFGSWHFHLPARLQFKEWIDNHNPDIIHGFGTGSAYGLIAVEQSCAGIVSIQGIQKKLAQYQERFSRIQRGIRSRIESKVISLATGLIAESDFAYGWVKDLIPQADVSIIPHAVNPEFTHTTSDYSRMECLCIGTINRTKSVDTSIRALAIANNKELKLSIIGRGPLIDEMRELAQSYHLENRVIFHGHLDRTSIVKRMSTARMLVILSKMDTSPNVLTEAHAVGLPVIGTRAGGIPDMINNGEDGYLVDVDDYRAVAAKMDLLANRTDLCKELGQKGKEKVKRFNDPDRIAELHVRFYRHILESANSE
ncbi:MAG: glycosyltransferase family 4 protein [Candidatus Thorarchaeota archaeon]